jgi:hypothetical protein
MIQTSYEYDLELLQGRLAKVSSFLEKVEPGTWAEQYWTHVQDQLQKKLRRLLH